MKKQILLTFALLSSPLISMDAKDLPSKDYPRAAVMLATLRSCNITLDMRTDDKDTFTVKGTILPGTVIENRTEETNLHDTISNLHFETPIVSEGQPHPNYLVSYPPETRLVLVISSGAQVNIITSNNNKLMATIHNTAKLHINSLKAAEITVQDGGTLEVDRAEGLLLQLNVYGGKATFHSANYYTVKFSKHPFVQIPETSSSFPSILINSGKINQLEGYIETSAIDYKNAQPIVVVRASIEKAEFEATSFGVVQKYAFEGTKQFRASSQQKGKWASTIPLIEYEPK
jgi:hypothetical protein